MTETEQQRLFKRVRRRFRQWPKQKCSGYVHGVADHERGLDPSEDMIDPTQYTESGDIYAIGYMYGYADAHGLDVEYEHWYIGRVEYRWWEK